MSVIVDIVRPQIRCHTSCELNQIQQIKLVSNTASKTSFTHTKKMGMTCQILGTVPRLPVLRLPPGGSLSTRKILSTGATFHLGPVRLPVEIGSAVS